MAFGSLLPKGSLVRPPSTDPAGAHTHLFGRRPLQGQTHPGIAPERPRRVGSPRCASGVCWYEHVLDELVQPVQVDVCQNWADHAPLRCPAQGAAIAPFFQVARFQQVLEQAQEAVVAEFLAEYRQHDFVVDVVEAPFDVSLNEPSDSMPVVDHVA